MSRLDDALLCYLFAGVVIDCSSDMFWHYYVLRAMYSGRSRFLLFSVTRATCSTLLMYFACVGRYPATL